MIRFLQKLVKRFSIQEEFRNHEIEDARRNIDTLVAQMVKNPPEKWETWVQGWELMYTCGGFMSMYDKTNTVL